MRTTSLANQFLLAMPNMLDANFHRTVVFVCQHDKDGATGLVLNRPSDMAVGDVLRQMELPARDGVAAAKLVYVGGPVASDRGFVLHSGDQQYQSSFRVAPNLTVTTSRDVLAAIAEGHGPSEFLFALGYAGWGAGQLEGELRANAWLNTPCDNQLIFRMPPAERYEAAAALLGVTIAQLNPVAGNA
jgi:putative transcriptional regulator